MIDFAELRECNTSEADDARLQRRESEAGRD